MHDFRRLHVWQHARTLAVELDALTRGFPSVDHGVVGGQLRRSALSIPANLAEGCGKNSRRETLRFLEIAAGSAAETEHHILMACDLGYVSADATDVLLASIMSVRRMLSGLIMKLPV